LWSELEGRGREGGKSEKEQEWERENKRTEKGEGEIGGGRAREVREGGEKESEL